MRRGCLARVALWIVLFAAPTLAQTAPPDTAAPAAAALDRTEVPTAGEHAALLRVNRPGRFAIKAASPTGTA